MADAAVPAPPLPCACWSCARVIEPADRYCRHCGSGQGEHVAWYYRRWGMALATALGLGPFGLILVWRAPRLSAEERALWTAGILALTAWLGWRLYQALRMMNEVMRMALTGF